MTVVVLFPLFLPLVFSFDFLPFLNDRPIIGVLSIPSDFPDRFPPSEYSDFGSAYVKFLEASGSRVVPILYDYDDATLRKLFNSVNGILFTGGDAPLWLNSTTMTGLSNFSLTVHKLLNWTIEANDRGDFFPVWGTCLGFESLVLYFSGNLTLDKYDDLDHTSNLTFLNDDNLIYAGLPREIQEYTETKSPIFVWHKVGKNYDAYLKEEKLYNSFKVDTINHDKNGKIFISSIEHRKYPIFGTQFHPEVSVFQFGPDIFANHDPETIWFSQFLGNFFNVQARKNTHRFENKEEEKENLIYNFNPVKYLNGVYDQAYIFKNPNKRK